MVEGECDIENRERSSHCDRKKVTGSTGYRGGKYLVDYTSEVRDLTRKKERRSQLNKNRGLE